MDKLGIYIHIPFCIRKCNYCDFCSYPDRKDEQMREYANELCRRICEFGKANGKRNVDTVYFGGGTPTLMPTDCFEQILTTLGDSFNIEKSAEITAECNPASIDAKGLLMLRRIGINRLSIGLQSANDLELRLLGRLHSFADFKSTFADARAAGFDNISVDLMYGIPAQTHESFKKTLKEVCKLSPEHISAYGLKIEEGTAFDACRNSLPLPDEDTEYEMYLLCESVLSEYGYERYEISNFARKGFESRHNLRYWQMNDYIGFGVSAHSCFEGERFANSRDINAFVSGNNIECERRKISSDERENEYLMLGLRLQKGIDISKYECLYGKELLTPLVRQYIQMGFLDEKDGHIAFTSKGFFVSNAILSEILDTDTFE